MSTVQPKTEDNRRFLMRFEAFKLDLSLTVVEACRRIGISEGRLSDIRNDRAKVSRRFWWKLLDAEKAAGLSRENLFEAEIKDDLLLKLRAEKITLSEEEIEPFASSSFIAEILNLAEIVVGDLVSEGYQPKSSECKEALEELKRRIVGYRPKMESVRRACESESVKRHLRQYLATRLEESS